ncbi:hypothetical protein CEXT_576911 [Caerostris extrusa]|uniref:Uncharacterized protein n=1 Tax=Caerostris extrusa TaxID=172846 RepID=A0AAV4XI80_CAEEX|nr:hypothetical protein CEXT_576911 [Caerostris extrusa]
MRQLKTEITSPTKRCRETLMDGNSQTCLARGHKKRDIIKKTSPQKKSNRARMASKWPPTAWRTSFLLRCNFSKGEEGVKAVNGSCQILTSDFKWKIYQRRSEVLPFRSVTSTRTSHSMKHIGTFSKFGITENTANINQVE